MKINTTLAIALLITGSSLYADQLYSHGAMQDRQQHRGERRHNREVRPEGRRNSRDPK